MINYGISERAVVDGSVDIIKASVQLENESELIERKGAGHPDSIADELAALVSQAYSKYTIDNCDGMILHHQIDKLMIIGGKAEVDFGKGRFVEPIRIVLSGRISREYLGKTLPVKQIYTDVIKDYFADRFPMVDFSRDIQLIDFLTSYAGPGTIKESSGSIAHMFNPAAKEAVRGYEALVANDTSYCVAYEPLSDLEAAIYNLERYLTDKKTKEKYPWLGSDIKIMAYRQGKNVDMTSCIPQIAMHVHSMDSYLQNLDTIAKEIETFIRKAIPKYDVHFSLNTKDKFSTKNIYLTVTGASLSGDIGVVGRGNRTNGLITAHRPMSLEGTNGKNPRYYSGFIYAVATKNIAKRIYNETSEPCIVEIVSQNGGNLLAPWHTRVTTLADAAHVQRIVTEELADIPTISNRFAREGIVNH